MCKRAREIAEDFQWRFGEKEVRIAEKHLGLKAHLLRCGDLTSEFGSIILLEDDLLVSPVFYSFVLEASVFYKGQKNIAGISLYKYEITDFYHTGEYTSSGTIPDGGACEDLISATKGFWGNSHKKTYLFFLYQLADNITGLVVSLKSAMTTKAANSNKNNW